MSILPRSEEDTLIISSQQCDTICLDEIQPLTTAQIDAINSFDLGDWANNRGWTTTYVSNTHSSINIGTIGNNGVFTGTQTTLNYIDDYLESTKPKTKYIIAGSFAEYNSFLKHKGYDSNVYIFVNTADTLRGLKDIHGYYVGSWKLRKDIEDIKLNIELANLD